VLLLDWQPVGRDRQLLLLCKSLCFPAIEVTVSLRFLMLRVHLPNLVLPCSVSAWFVSGRGEKYMSSPEERSFRKLSVSLSGEHFLFGAREKFTIPVSLEAIRSAF